MSSSTLTDPKAPPPPSGFGNIKRAWLPEKVIHYGVWVLAVLLILGPIVPIVWSSLWSTPLYESGGNGTLDNFGKLATDPLWWSAVANSLQFALFATIGSVVVGTTVALLVARTNLPLRRIYSALIVLPLVLPGLVLIVGWQSMWSKNGYATHLLEEYTPFTVPFDLYSVAGMVVMGTVLGSPVVYLFARGTLSSGDSTLEEAARCAGAGPLRALLSVTLPLLRPALLNSGLLVFALALETLGIPLILGTSKNINMMSTYLYRQWTGSADAGGGVLPAGAVMLLLAVTLLLLLRNRLAGDLARFTTTGGKSSRPANVVKLGPFGWLLSAVIGIVLGCATLVPLSGVVLASVTALLTPAINPFSVLTLENFSAILTNPLYTGAIGNSLLIATVGAAIATACIAVIALVAHRSNFRLRGSLEHIVLYPRAVPGLITGMAFFWTFAILDHSGTFRATLWAVGIAFGVRALAMGYAAFYPSLAALGADLDRAARLAGADWWTAMRTIILSLLRPAMGISFVLLFVAMLNEADAAVFLVTPETQVLGLAMLQIAANGLGGTVAALGVIQLVITAAVLGAGRILFGVRPHA